MFCSSLLKRDPRKVNSSVNAMLVGVTVAVVALHVVLKTRVGETNILGIDIPSLSMSIKSNWSCSSNPFLKRTRGR